MARQFSVSRNEARAGFLFVLPAMVLLFAFIVVPIVLAARISLFDFPLLAPNRKVFVGFDNYVDAFREPLVVKAFLNTAYYAVWVVILQTTVGLGLAMLIARQFRGVTVFRVGYYTPVVVSMVVASVLWRVMLDSQNGLFNAILSTLHLPRQPFLTSQVQALPTLAVMLTWKWVGFSMLVFMAGLHAIPKELYEAGTVDGATPVQRFFLITLPLVKQPALYILVTNTINAFKLFTPIYVITQGGPQNATMTVVYYVFREVFRYNRMGYGASVAVLFTVVMIGFAVVQLRALREDRA